MYNTSSNDNAPSLSSERAALEKCGNRTTKTILAVFHSRRLAKIKEFFVSPQIAEFHGLSPKDLNWGLDRLEGLVTQTIEGRKGRFRRIRLLPSYEGSPSSVEYAPASPRSYPDEEKILIDTEEILARVAATLGR